MVWHKSCNCLKCSLKVKIMKTALRQILIAWILFIAVFYAFSITRHFSHSIHFHKSTTHSQQLLKASFCELADTDDSDRSDDQKDDKIKNIKTDFKISFYTRQILSKLFSFLKS